MFEGRVLGVDPGLGTAGAASVGNVGGRLSLLWSSTLRTSPDLPLAERLRALHEAIRAAIAEHRPDALAVERVMWGRNTSSALAVAHAAGVVMLAAAEARVPVEEYAPLEVKMAVTGIGNAGKEQVRAALSRLHGLGEIPRQPDAADAVAVALCHCLQSHLRSVATRAGAR